MTEYLFYVSLVFIPIACWIAYLLHQDGFDIKTITLVLVLSYLMITAFPFSVQHLGTGITILVYSTIFAVLILVMCKPELFNINGQSDELGSELAGKSSLTVPGGETTIFAVSTAAVKMQQSEVPPAAGNHCQSEPQEAGIMTEEVINEVVSLPVVDLQVESVSAHNLTEAQEPDSLPEQVITAAEHSDMVIAGDLPSPPQPDLEPLYLQDSENMLEGQCGESGEDHNDTQAEELLSADGHNPDTSESVIIDSTPEHQTAVSEDGPEHEAIGAADYSEAPAAVDYHQEVQDNLNQDVKVFSDAAAILGDGGQPSYQTELADWIEMGFEAKAQGDLDGAAQNFTRALQVSTDDELKYLLGMELVSILQNTGNYEEAEIILDDLIQTISVQPAMIMELRQQKQYISLLADELNRLGLAGTPIFEVPRFVRMKVNEKMLA